MSRTLARTLAVLTALALVAAACSSGDDDDSSSDTTGGAKAEKIDYTALGLWDDGPCDVAKPPLKLGLMTVFESPVLSLKDQADALKVAATAFNKRGGANGSCIKVTTCDDGGNVDQAVACVRTIDNAGVVATVNDQGTAGQRDVSEAMRTAKIPRIASNVTQDDWSDPNAYPLDASGTGVTFLLPQALINEDIHKIGTIRVDLPAASALLGLLKSIYEGDATFPYDVPVPGGTTDFNQFILGAQNAGADGVTLALGEQEAIQVVRAGQQLDTDLKIGASLGSFSRDDRRSGRLRQEDGLPVVVRARDDGHPRVQSTAGRPRGIGRQAAPTREPQGQSDAFMDRALRPAQDDARREDDLVHSRGHHRDVATGEGRPDAGHVRRRELDAEREPPGPLQPGGHRPVDGVRMGSELEDRRVRRQLRREVAHQLRQDAVRFTLRWPLLIGGARLIG